MQHECVRLAWPWAGATGDVGWALVPKGLRGSVSVGFWGTNASGTAWLPFSNKSAEKVWENGRETKSESQKGAEIMIKKRRRRRRCPVRVSSERFLTTPARVGAVPCPKGLLPLARRETGGCSKSST